MNDDHKFDEFKQPLDFITPKERLKPRAERRPDDYYDEWDDQSCVLGAALVYAVAGFIFGCAFTYVWFIGY